MKTQLLISFVTFLLLAACSPGPDLTPTSEQNTGSVGQAVIENLEIQQIAGEDLSYQVVVRGHLTNTCTRITRAESELENDEISISVGTTLLEDVNCLDENIDFERVVPLSNEALEPGEYSLLAGTLKETFEFSATPSSTAAIQDPPTPSQAGPGSIVGLVWHDECINQSNGSPDHAGCVESGAVYVADGVLDGFETGIADVRVDLGEGACPTGGIARVSTASDGSFEFSNLEEGTYCVSVNPAIPENQAPLGDGVWTAPDGTSGAFTVEVTEASTTSEIALGWDFLNLPQFVSEDAPEPDCIPRAAYYGDVTIPDNTVMEPGEKFVKTWRIRNEGTCTWGPGYEAIFGNGDQMRGSPTPLPAAEPGEIVEVSVELTAPEESGYYRGNWGFRDPHGTHFSVGASGTTPIWVQIVVSFYSGTSPTNPSATPTCGEELNSDYTNVLLELVNGERAKRSLPPLRLQEQLSAAAQVHSSDMACNDFLSHTGSADTTYRDRVQMEGYTKFSYLTENIYAGNPNYGGTPVGAVEWWMNSKVHRDAILHPTVTEIGIGYAFFEGSNYGAYYTLVFAEPTS